MATGQRFRPFCVGPAICRPVGTRDGGGGSVLRASATEDAAYNGRLEGGLGTFGFFCARLCSISIARESRRRFQSHWAQPPSMSDVARAQVRRRRSFASRSSSIDGQCPRVVREVRRNPPARRAAFFRRSASPRPGQLIFSPSTLTMVSYLARRLTRPARIAKSAQFPLFQRLRSPTDA